MKKATVNLGRSLFFYHLNCLYSRNRTGLLGRGGRINATKGHVLYGEGHDDTRVLMTIMLTRVGFQVTPAQNGSECLKLAQSSGQDFDLYLLDQL